MFSFVVFFFSYIFCFAFIFFDVFCLRFCFGLVSVVVLVFFFCSFVLMLCCFAFLLCCNFSLFFQGVKKKLQVRMRICL